MNRWRLGGLGVCLLALIGCANSTPEISIVFDQVNRVYDPSQQRWSEGLSVFVLAQNADGVGELDRLHLINDSQGLYWTIPKANWTRVNRNTETWIGLNRLHGVEPTIPSGTWRLVLVTRGGQRVDSQFVLPPPLAQRPSLDSLAPIQLSHTGGPQPTFTVKGLPKDYLLWAYNDQGEFLLERKMISPSFRWSEWSVDPELVDRIATVVFYSYDKAAGQGIEAGPFAVK